MFYSSKLLEDGRYGIFIKNQLIATISCPNTYQKIVKALEGKKSYSEQSETFLESA